MIHIRLEGSPVLGLPSAPISVPDGLTLLQLIRQRGIHPDSVVPLLEGLPIPIDSPLEDGQTIILIPVVSGGGPVPMPAPMIVAEHPHC